MLFSGKNYKNLGSTRTIGHLSPSVELSGPDEMVEGSPGDAHDLGDGSLGDLFLSFSGFEY